MANNESQLILQFIDRIVDENIRSAEALTSLKFAIQEQRNEINEILQMLKNEIRTDIKDHVSSKSDNFKSGLIVKLEKIEAKFDTLATENREHIKRNEEIDRVLTDIRKKGIWFRGFLVVVTSIATIVAGAIYFSRVSGIVNSDTRQTQTENSSE